MPRRLSKKDAARFKLLGEYKTPRFRYGAVVECEVRGPVKIVAITDAPIPWPIGQGLDNSARSLVVYRGLAKAVRRESNIAIQHWWGVGKWCVWKWRRALNVEANNEGTLNRRVAASSTPEFKKKVLPKLHAKARDPERRAKIAAAKRGKKRPKHVIEAMRKANIGRKHSAETRQKMSEAWWRHGPIPRQYSNQWTKEEEEMLRRLPVAEVAKRTGRTEMAVRMRLTKLGLKAVPAKK